MLVFQHHSCFWCQAWNSHRFPIFFRSLNLKDIVLYTGFVCKIIDQEQELFNFDRFIYNFGYIYWNTVQILIQVAQSGNEDLGSDNEATVHSLKHCRVVYSYLVMASILSVTQFLS